MPTYRNLVVQRGHDYTPIEVSFGSMAGHLAPFARYMVLEEGMWKSKTYEDMQKLKRGPLAFGRIEMFGQTCEICYTEFDSNAQQARKLVCMPSILERGSASCINSGCERGLLD